MITLTSPLTFAVGGVTQETADHSAAASISFAWLPMKYGDTNSVGAYLSYGALAGSPAVFTQSFRADPVLINVEVTTGAWNCPSTGQTGTLTPAQLTTIQNALKNLRNTLESFAVTSGVMPGTQTPW